jgi:hypothetical protein
MDEKNTHAYTWIESEAVRVIGELMDIIERETPEIYYKSDEIMRANDLLSYVDHHGLTKEGHTISRSDNT